MTRSDIIKSYAVSVFASLSDKKKYLFIKLFAYEETIEKFESAIIKKCPEAKEYTSVNDYLTDNLSDMDYD